MSDFSAKTLRLLAKKGIRLIGLTVIPNAASDMPFATGDRGYCMDDNGCHRIWTFQQVLEAAR
jgi:hypothetical protein